MQALLDSLPHNPISFALQTAILPNTNPPQTNTVVVCPAHKQSYCEICGVDFNALNYMHQFLRTAPPEAIPPPPNVQPPPQRAEMIRTMKEAGNVRDTPLIEVQADFDLDRVQEPEFPVGGTVVLQISRHGALPPTVGTSSAVAGRDFHRTV